MIKRNKTFAEQITTMKCNSFDSDHPSGWLDNNGKLHKCRWGQHSEFAGDYVQINDLWDELNEFENEYGGHLYAGDFLANKGWVLIDCPMGDGYVKLTFKTGKLTKQQKEYLLEYLTKVDDMITARRILEN